MAHELIKDTAMALIFTSGKNFDTFAFENLDLSEDEINEICDEVIRICNVGLKRLGKKYGTIPTGTTDEIVEHILFE